MITLAKDQKELWKAYKQLAENQNVIIEGMQKGAVDQVLRETVEKNMTETGQLLKIVAQLQSDQSSLASKLEETQVILQKILESSVD